MVPNLRRESSASAQSQVSRSRAATLKASGLLAGFWDHLAVAHFVRNGCIIGGRQSGLYVLIEVTNLGFEVSQ
jgi:hypothetical protein